MSSPSHPKLGRGAKPAAQRKIAPPRIAPPPHGQSKPTPLLCPIPPIAQARLPSSVRLQASLVQAIPRIAPPPSRVQRKAIQPWTPGPPIVGPPPPTRPIALSTQPKAVIPRVVPPPIVRQGAAAQPRTTRPRIVPPPMPGRRQNLTIQPKIASSTAEATVSNGSAQSAPRSFGKSIYIRPKFGVLQKILKENSKMVLDKDTQIGWCVYEKVITDFGNGGFSFPTLFAIKGSKDGYIIQNVRVTINNERKHEFLEAFPINSVMYKKPLDYFNNPPSESLAIKGRVIVAGACGFFTGELPDYFTHDNSIPSGAAKATNKKPSFFPSFDDSCLVRRLIIYQKEENKEHTIKVYSEKSIFSDYTLEKKEFSE